MAASARKAPASTRKFGLLRFIAYLHVFIGVLIFVAGVVVAFVTPSVNQVFNQIMIETGGQAVRVDGGATTAAALSLFVGASIFALVYIGIGHMILAFLSIEEHTRRSAIAQEQLLRANMQLLRQLDQRLP